MKRFNVALLFCCGIHLVQSKKEDEVDKVLLNIERWKSTNEGRGRWLTESAGLVPITPFPAFPPPIRCSQTTGTLVTETATCPPFTVIPAVPSSPATGLPTLIVEQQHHPTSGATFAPTGETPLPSDVPSYSLAPSISNYPSVLPTLTAKPTLLPIHLPTKPPTARPSAFPSMSVLPAISSTPVIQRIPTENPTVSPSKPPTNLPTPSQYPSQMPSPFPSNLPIPLPSSIAPTSVPSTRPSVPPSRKPSSLASSVPSHGTSYSPSANPTQIPTTDPSPSSSPSTVSSSGSQKPSSSVSSSGSQKPSTSSSMSPSKSSAPSILLFDTQPTTDSNGNAGENSTCLNSPPNNSLVPQTQVLTFDFNIYLTQGSSANNQTGPIERRLHEDLANYYLTCQFNRRQLQGVGFFVEELSSLPADTLSSTPCSLNQTIENTTCYVVNGGVTIDLLFAMTRTAANILASFGAFLSGEMDSGRLNGGNVVGTRFIGFTNVQGVPNSTPDTKAAVQQNESTNSSRKTGIIAGAAAVAAAVLILLIVLFLVIRRKRFYRQEVYLKQDDDLREIEGDESTDLGTELYTKSIVVNDEEISFASSLKGIKLEKKAERGPSGTNSNVHKCSSSNCEVCQNSKHTTFVTADWRDIQGELGPRRYRSKRTRRYVADDTVDL